MVCPEIPEIMASKPTKRDLTEATDYLGFESLCHDLMSREGYKSIQPLGGTGDKGRDAIHFDKSTSISTVFAYSVRKDWETKLEGDLKTVSRHEHECDQFVFVSTSLIPATKFDEKKKEVKQAYGWDLYIFDLERISTLIDNHHADLINRHSNIFHISSKLIGIETCQDFDPEQYAGYLLGLHEWWVEQYTPLLAEHREIDTFVGLQGETENLSKLPVVDIPEKGRISMLLGESGAGKTTSLWEIVVRSCRLLTEGGDGSVPVLFSLRGWSPEKSCRELLQEQFSLLDIPRSVIEQHLKSGSFLLLLDGFNEVRQANAAACYLDIANFISSYRNNSCVIACRSSDFNANLIPTKECRPPLPDPDVYEICRLDRKQVIEYSNSYLAEHSVSSEEFFDRLHIHDDVVWEDITASVQLTRIPLYLQIYLDVFRQTRCLPDGRVMLHKALVDRILDRERARGSVGVDKLANEYLLGGLSFRSTRSGYSMRFSERYAHEQIMNILEILRARGIITAAVTLGEVWRGILSANFIKSVDGHSVEWLHQLIRDYFLGVEYARIWDARDDIQLRYLQQRLMGKMWDTAYTIALGLLDERSGATFLWLLITADEENARRAFENQTECVRAALINTLVCNILEKGDYESKELKTISHALPYREVVEVLDSNFYSASSDEMRVLLVGAISEMVMEYYPKLCSSEKYSWSALHEARNQTTTNAVKRSEELLRKYLRNKNEIISFYAAKGLWERDRPAVVAQLKKLLSSQNSMVISMVKDLIDEWGID